MAKFDGKHFRGVIGRYSLRVVGGEQIAQSRPRKYQLTEASKESGAEFGLASTLAKNIRTAFASLHTNIKDGSRVNRLVRAVLNAVRSDKLHERGERDIASGEAGFLEGFEFNSKAPLATALGVKPVCSLSEGRVHVKLPAFNVYKDLRMRQAANGGLLSVKVIAFDFVNRRYKQLGESTLDFQKSAPDVNAQEWTFDADVPDGCVIITGMSLEFYRGNAKRSRNVEGAEDSAALVSVIKVVQQQPALVHDGTETEPATPKWTEMAINLYRTARLQRKRMKQKPQPVEADEGKFAGRAVTSSEWKDMEL